MSNFVCVTLTEHDTERLIQHWIFDTSSNEDFTSCLEYAASPADPGSRSIYPQEDRTPTCFLVYALVRLNHSFAIKDRSHE